jgi:hydrogenase nickel incorporation protein HypA/HybF
MHEMALTESVVEIALQEMRKAGAAQVRRIVLDIGRLSAVEPEAMRFCFAAVARGTAAQAAELAIEDVAGAGWCLDCARTVALKERFGPCPSCGGYHVQMTVGDEMRVRELEVC